MRVKLTKTILEREHAAIVAAGTGRKIIWDTGDVVGFGARLSPGRVVLFLNYRSGGVERRMTVARLGECTIEQARKRAAELKLQIRAGLDPLATLRETRRAAVSKRITVASAVDKWHKANLNQWRPLTAKKYRGIIDYDVISRLGDKELAAVTRADWSDLLIEVGQRSPSLAALLRSVIGSFVNWCVDRELLPAANLPSARRVTPKQPVRDRVVTDDEVVRIWSASKTLRAQDQAFARFIFLTAMRSGAAAETLLSWVRDGAVYFPGTVMKNGEPHRVALSPWAWEQIAVNGLKPGGSLFGGKPLSGDSIQKVLKALRKESGVDFVFHDARRSFRSFGAKHGLSRDACETVLAHRIHRNAVDEAYMRHDFQREAEHALFAWQAHIRLLVEGESADNVVTLTRG